VVPSSGSLPSAEADDEAAEQELLDDNVRDRTVNELWMDFDVLFKCFRSDSCNYLPLCCLELLDNLIILLIGLHCSLLCAD